MVDGKSYAVYSSILCYISAGCPNLNPIVFLSIFCIFLYCCWLYNKISIGFFACSSLSIDDSNAIILIDLVCTHTKIKKTDEIGSFVRKRFFCILHSRRTKSLKGELALSSNHKMYVFWTFFTRENFQIKTLSFSSENVQGQYGGWRA